MKKAKPRSSRAIAAVVLSKVLFQGQSLTQALAQTPHNLADNDKALVQQLCFGVCRYAHQLQGITNHFLQKPIKAKEHEVKSLVWLGAYQLLHTRVPDHAAIGATVDAAKEFGKPWASGLINGLLRNLQRALKSEATPWPITDELSTSHPQWLVNTLQEAWPEQWQNITEANNQQAPMTLRVNALNSTREAYLEQLHNQDIEAKPCEWAEHGIVLQQATSVERLPHFAQGYASVQDEAPQLSAQLLQIEAGHRVLDACAAPGGKTCHILELYPNIQELVAVELEEERLKRVKENAERLNLNPILKCADATELNAWWDKTPFDRILLDAPCSATGVIRRHPDIKWLRRASDIDKLAQLQQSLLNTLWQTLKPGGILVYATCSVLPQENTHNVEQFLQNNSDASELPIQAKWGQACTTGRQLFPQVDGHDGFYYAILRKSAQ